MILIVEDNPTQQKVLAYLAKHHGFEAHIVSTAGEAIAALERSERYQLMLMDWTLPDMTGLDCTVAIRLGERGTERHIPIIAMTGHALDGDRERCLQAGMDDYLSKPFTAVEFRDVLLRWIPHESESSDEFPFGQGFSGGETQPAQH